MYGPRGAQGVLHIFIPWRNRLPPRAPVVSADGPRAAADIVALRVDRCFGESRDSPALRFPEHDGGVDLWCKG